jgi:hypothetical protein
VYLEDDLLRATKIAAARTGKRDYQVVEEALRAYLGLELLERVGARSNLKEDEALDLAYRELHQSRRCLSGGFRPRRTYLRPHIRERGTAQSVVVMAGRLVRADRVSPPPRRAGEGFAAAQISTIRDGTRGSSIYCLASPLSVGRARSGNHGRAHPRPR